MSDRPTRAASRRARPGGPWRDRRGAAAATFAVAAFALIAFVALATEAGTWYFARSRAQDVADAAAIAAVLANAGGNSASTAGTTVATDNGYTTGLTINSPPDNCYVSGSTCSTSSTSQFEAVMQISLTPYLSTLFTSVTPTITAHGVAQLKNRSNGIECMLSLSGDLSIQQNQYALRCSYGSNATDTTAVSISSGSTVQLYSITTAGDCSTSGCANSGVTLSTPYSSYQPASTDPYSALKTASAITLPSTCGTISKVTTTSHGVTTATTVTLTPGLYDNGTSCSADTTYESGGVFTMGVLTGATTWKLTTGTYYFSNVSLAITGGTIECVTTSAGTTTCGAGSGVSIVLTGSPTSSTGSLYICAMSAGSCSGATAAVFDPIGVTGLSALLTNSSNSLLNGVLFYRDYRAGAGSPGVWIQGSSSTQMYGALYFPSSNAYYGNSASTNCTIVVAGTLTLRDVATTTATSATNCSPYVASAPQAQVARLLE